VVSEKLLLTPEETAEQLGLSRTQVYRLLAARRLRSVKIGKLRRISQGALREFVERAEEEPLDSK
jgi:excisionase family DNA binding protein